MEILIRSSFDNVETAETCVKRIREAQLGVKEITLIPPKYLREGGDDDRQYIPATNYIFPGTLNSSGGVVAFGVVDTGGHDDRKRADYVSGDAIIEIVTDSSQEDKIRSIIINSGGRDTTKF